MKDRDRRAAIEQLSTIPETEERLVLATGQFIGEGFDDARLDTLFLAMPVLCRGTLIQYVGRLHRAHNAKTDVRMIDYMDRNVPMLANMFEKRMKGYKAMGYSVGDHPTTGPERSGDSEQRQIGLI
jgi:superfamily II DNA or RNA helicase